MTLNHLNIRDYIGEKDFTFRTSRSSGPGGQHVNKVNTKIELLFDLNNSPLFNQEQKDRVYLKLKSYINSEGIIVIQSQQSRSQSQNKEDAIYKFYTLMEKALKPVKKRKPTKPTRSSIEKRLSNKRIKSEKKQNRNFKF